MDVRCIVGWVGKIDKVVSEDVKNVFFLHPSLLVLLYRGFFQTHRYLPYGSNQAFPKKCNQCFIACRARHTFALCFLLKGGYCTGIKHKSP